MTQSTHLSDEASARPSSAESDGSRTQATIHPQFLPRIGRHLAHELNNPISAISSAAYLIQDFIDTAEGGQLDVELVKPFIESIREECLKMKTIVEEFAKYTTTESILTVPLDLTEFLRMRAEELRKEGLPIEFESPEEPVRVMADAAFLQTAVKSLACFASQSGASSIELAVKGTPGGCTISVADNRPGELSAEDIEDVFNPLPRKRTPGLGLKLPLVKKIVDLHNGAIEMTSQPGHTSICIDLPFAPNS